MTCRGKICFAVRYMLMSFLFLVMGCGDGAGERLPREPAASREESAVDSAPVPVERMMPDPERVYTPGREGSVRKALLDALRASVEEKLHQDVIFEVEWLKVRGNWAFMRGVPRRADGGPVDYRNTIYREAVEEGVFDDWICALLTRSGDRWIVTAEAIGATDVPYVGWHREFAAPREIFDHTDE